MHFFRKPHIVIILFQFLFITVLLAAEKNNSMATKRFESDIKKKQISKVKYQNAIDQELQIINEKIRKLEIQRQKKILELASKEKAKTQIANIKKFKVAYQETLPVQTENNKLNENIEPKYQKDNNITAHIDLSKQEMHVFQGNNLMYKWRVSTARRGYVTPVGNYHPQFLERMHYSKRYHNSPMPHSIFFKGNFAIHGTNSIRRLGRRASHGCVRLHPRNAEKLYALVKKYGKANILIKITH